MKSNMKFVENQNINLNYDERISKWKKSLKKNLINLSQNKKILLVYPLPKPPINISRHIKKITQEVIYIVNNYYLKDEINYDKKIYEQIKQRNH